MSKQKKQGESERKFSIYEPRWTHGETVDVTGVTSKSLHNWVAREIVVPEELVVRSGRRFYSALDVIAIAAMAELTELKVPPLDAWEIATRVKYRSEELLIDKLSHEFAKAGVSVGPKNPIDILVRYIDGELSVAERSRTERSKWEPEGSYIVVPADRLTYRILKRLFEIE